MIKIALDAMGGDFAPDVVIDGAVRAVKGNEDKFHIVLCGPKAQVEEGLKRLGYQGSSISVFDAPELVAMDEHPTEVLRKKQTSGLVLCVGLQKKGLVQASVFVDAGANVDEKPVVLRDFAIAGSVFAECQLGIKNPKVGLLNMGEEEKKGPASVQEAHQLLKTAPVNFIGNIEGRDVVLGKADVIVCSGFVGNVVLKMLEGFYELHQKMFGKIDSPAGRKFDEMWDYRTAGGALLLGLKGTGIIAHGRSDAKAIEQAVKVAYQFAFTQIPEKVGAKLASEIK